MHPQNCPSVLTQIRTEDGLSLHLVNMTFVTQTPVIPQLNVTNSTPRTPAMSRSIETDSLPGNPSTYSWLQLLIPPPHRHPSCSAQPYILFKVNRTGARTHVFDSGLASIRISFVLLQSLPRYLAHFIHRSTQIDSKKFQKKSNRSACSQPIASSSSGST